MASNDDKVYLPAQRVKRGVAGYRGENIMVVGKDGKAKAAPKDRKPKVGGSDD